MDLKMVSIAQGQEAVLIEDTMGIAEHSCFSVLIDITLKNLCKMSFLKSPSRCSSVQTHIEGEEAIEDDHLHWPLLLIQN